MNSFTYNEHGVCINAEVIMVYDPKGYDYAAVELSQGDDGKWYSGNSWHCHNGGGGGPCWQDPKNQYETRQDALLAALDDLKYHVERHVKQPNTEGDAARKFCKGVDIYKASLFQMSLF